VICKDNDAINFITVQHKRRFIPVYFDGSYAVAIEDSLFRVDYGLLWAFILVKHPQIIRYPLSTVCEDVITFCIK
jgi:hypothetical protein